MIGSLKGNISLTQGQIKKLRSSDLSEPCRVIIKGVEFDFIIKGFNTYHDRNRSTGQVNTSIGIDLIQVLEVDIEDNQKNKGMKGWEGYLFQ